MASASGFFQSIRDFVEKRRSVRIQEPGIDAIVSSGEGEKDALKVQDLSTSGIGLLLDFMPSEPTITVILKHEGVLNNFKARAEVRHVRKLDTDGGQNRYFAGCEFLFESSDYSRPLLRWLADRIDQEKKKEEYQEPEQKEPAKKRVASRSSRSSIQPGLAVSRKDLESVLRLLDQRPAEFSKPETRFFIAYHRDSIASVLPLTCDIPGDTLSLGEPYDEVLHRMRSEDRRPGRIHTPFFNQKWVDSIDPRMAPMKKLDTLFSSFSLTLLYVLGSDRITDLVTMTPPHLEEFYRMWLFTEPDEARKLPRADLRLLVLRLENFEERVASERPEILSRIEKYRNSFNFEKALKDLFVPDEAFVREWFS